jgi:hypothetical protein
MRILGIGCLFGVVLALVSGGTCLAVPVSGSLQRERFVVSLRLSPASRSASWSHFFAHADTGLESLELVAPRGIRLELLVRTPVEAATGAPPDVAFCTPRSVCGAADGIADRCRDSGRAERCRLRAPSGDPAFQQGRWTLSVRGFGARSATVKLRAVFVRGLGA